MFSTIIEKTPFNSEDANIIFKNISETNPRRDASFISTLRALVSPRMNENDNIIVYNAEIRFTADEIKGLPTTRALQAITKYIRERGNSIALCNFCAEQEVNLACIALVNSDFEDKFPGWTKISKISDFYKKKFEVSCFVHIETKRVVLFVDRLDVATLHYLQCSIPVMLPWYFDPEDGLSELELNLLKSCQQTDGSKYIECINKIAEPYDFRKLKLERLLKGIEAKIHESERESLERRIEETDDAIERHNIEVRELLSRRYEINTRLMGILSRVNEKENSSEIMDYFMCNKSLELQSVEGSEITFIVKDYFSYFDEASTNSVINNPNSVLYNADGDYEELIITEDEMETLMRAIFINKVLKMRVTAAFRYDLRSSVSAIQDYNYTDATYMPNPHLDGYSCLGGYYEVINTLAKDNDHIGIIEQCIASCKSLDFTDHTVLSRFTEILYGDNDDGDKYHCCIETPEGEVLTIAEAVEWLKKKR